MYWTIWTALLLFTAGEIGKRTPVPGVPGVPGAPGLPWWAWAAGVSLCAIHIVLAMSITHGWSHAAAVAATARATNAVYGLDWGGGVYVNYAFVLVWAFETAWWRLSLATYARRPAAVIWTLRVFYLVIIVNAAIVFAAGWRRLLGAALTATLVWIWIKPEARS